MDASTLASIAFAGIAVFGAGLAALAGLALRRAPSPRMALVAFGFLLITVQGVLVSVGLLAGAFSATTLLLISGGFEAALLVVLFAATLVR